MAAGISFAAFPIAARCARTNQLGVAVSTAAFGVGAFVPFGRAGIGVVSTQAMSNPYLAHPILDRLAAGDPPVEAVDAALTKDVGREFRQVAVLDALGRGAAFTGQALTPWAGQLPQANSAIAGNTLAGPLVVELIRSWRLLMMLRRFSELTATQLACENVFRVLCRRVTEEDWNEAQAAKTAPDASI